MKPTSLLEIVGLLRDDAIATGETLHVAGDGPEAARWRMAAFELHQLEQKVRETFYLDKPMTQHAEPGEDRCETCGAALAHVAGTDLNAVICGACYPDELDELIHGQQP